MSIIRRIEAFELKLRLREPFRIAMGVSEYSHNIVVRIVDKEGNVGWGEGSPSLRVNRETVESNLSAIERVAPKLLGVDVFSIERVREILSRVEGNPSTKTAVETAVFDLIGKNTGRPVFKLLGGYRDYVITDITLGIKSPEDMARDAVRAVKRGFRILKVKLGTSPDEDIERVRLIREAVGDDIIIRVDANQGWKFDDAIRVLNKIADYNVELCEQPLPAGELEALAELRRLSPIPIMVDESVHGMLEALKVIEREAADYINIKLMKTGGIIEAMHLAYLAESVGIKCMIGCMGESLLGITMGVHFAQALKNIEFVDLDADLLLAESLVEKGGASIEKGGIRRAPSMPGLGIEALAENKLRLRLRKE